MNEVLGRGRPTNLSHMINGVKYGFQFGDSYKMRGKGPLFRMPGKSVCMADHMVSLPSSRLGLHSVQTGCPKMCFVYKESR